MYLTGLADYPEIHNKIRDMFPDVDRKIHNNIYAIFTMALQTPKFAVSRTHKNYKRLNAPDWFTYNRAVKTQDMLEEENLIKIEKGYPPRKGFNKGFSSVVVPTYKLEKILKGTELKPVKADGEQYGTLTIEREPKTPEEIRKMEDHFFEDSVLDKDSLISDHERVSLLNDNYFSGMSLDFEESVSLYGMKFEEAMEMIKERKDNAIGMATNVFFTSMYSNHGCGRLFQRCVSYQNVPKELRNHLLINGSKTSECDYSGMHINILLNVLCGKENPYYDDPYSPVLYDLGLKPKAHNDMRDAIKRCSIVLINVPNFVKFSMAMNGNHGEDVYKLAEPGLGLRDVYKSFLRVYDIDKEIKSHSKIPDKIMLHESNIVKNVLSRLDEENINGIPLHDAITCEKGKEERVKKIMKDEYVKYTSRYIANPKIRVKTK